MAQRFLSYSPAPVETAVVDPKRGNVLTQPWERWFDRLRDSILKRPTCRVYFASDQSISDNTQTDLLFELEDHDNAAMHDVSSNTDRITIPSDGVYCFGANVIWAAHATGLRGLFVTLNDAAPIASGASILNDSRHAATIASDNVTRSWAYGTLSLSAGDILRVNVLQTSGAGLAATGTTTNGPRANGFWCFRVSI